MNGFYPFIGGDLPPRRLDSRPSSARNTIAGFAKAVAGTAILIAFASVVIMSITSGGEGLTFIFFLALIGSTIVVALAGLVVGLPLTWVLASNRLEGPWTYPPVGFSVGATMVLLFHGLVFAWEPEAILASFGPLTLVGGLAGGIYGALWWYFHRRHVQDG